MTRKRAPKKRRKRSKWRTPREMFIYSDPPGYTTQEVAEEFEGHAGCSVYNIRRRCTSEHWSRYRKEHWERVDRRVAEKQEIDAAERRERQIAEATDRHIKVGQAMQGAAGVAMEKAVNIVRQMDSGEMDVKEGMRVMAMLVPLMAKGVDVERKGLGIADKFVVATHTREITQRVLVVIQKWVKSAEVYENIMQDLAQIDAEAKAQVDEVLEVN